MLTKPQAFYDNIHKQALGYQNSFHLKKAQRIKPTLYDGIVISDKHVAMPVINDEETLILEEEIRLKMSKKEKDQEAIKQNISHKPIDYEKLNRTIYRIIRKCFTPQQELSAEQAFWLRMSNPTSKPSDAYLVKIEAPKELFLSYLVNETLRKIQFHLAVEQAKAEQHLDKELDFACRVDQQHHVLPTPVLSYRITSANIVPPKKTTSHSVETQKTKLKIYSRKPKNVKNVGSSKKAKIIESKNANHSEPNHTWGSNATYIPSSSSLVMTGCPDYSLVSGLRMFKTYDREAALSTMKLCRKFLGISKTGLSERSSVLACALGKSKKSFHQPKAEYTNQEKLYLLHMDLFLRTKDEAPEAIIKCIKNIQVCLNATVRNVRTDNGTEFVNQALRKFYENVGISHQTSVARTP
ncbi:retrovirus-related pol polyprotein from transposon TNT 1-94 [Tanacetum coccineum]|uniref:Retrovirus-related pol polyprotein from transposon TNT 1-94 n=1 Tax=Tanacetum coccineum TaxID=301880 RepID=A0ABQ4ZRY1_9ASTR